MSGTVRLCPKRMAKKLWKRTILSANWVGGVTNRVTPLYDNISSSKGENMAPVWFWEVLLVTGITVPIVLGLIDD